MTVYSTRNSKSFSFLSLFIDIHSLISILLVTIGMRLHAHNTCIYTCTCIRRICEGNIRILRSSAQRHARGWELPLIYRRLESRLGISRRVNIRIEISSANSSKALWIFASLMRAASGILLVQSTELLVKLIEENYIYRISSREKNKNFAYL